MAHDVFDHGRQPLLMPALHRFIGMGEDGAVAGDSDGAGV
jgi:hypothetical protein